MNRFRLMGLIFCVGVLLAIVPAPTQPFTAVSTVLELTKPELSKSEPTEFFPPLATGLSASELLSQPLTPSVAYETYELARSTVHVLRVPTEHFVVTPAVSEELQPLEGFAQSTGAIAGVNGGFFDPANQLTTSHVVIQGEWVADPTENDRLITNPDLTTYLDRILNRSEFRQYQCGALIQYDITAHQDPIPEGCQLISSLGAGPRLLPQLTLVEEAFAEIVEGEFVRDAIGSRQPNARTAIGLTDSGEILLVMAAQQSESPTDSGMTLPELANFMGILGATAAMNLDGGSSSGLYYRGQAVQGEIFYGRVNAEGDRIVRPVKSVLLVHGR
ncbi:phosphodiester glycosidase family protein [Egbenema bharatensis]|uniref:phosphodiester glycosidase family protein n=1 Tax=Egbenema bharatensis TaxID=3463334 RepID=UPI003A89969D